MLVLARIVLCLLLCAFPVLSFAAESFDGNVVSVADGDTITVLTDQKRQIKVRLYGIDCPESRQAYGSRAKQFTSGKVFGQRVHVEVMDVDRYGAPWALLPPPTARWSTASF